MKAVGVVVGFRISSRVSRPPQLSRRLSRKRRDVPGTGTGMLNVGEREKFEGMS